MTKFKEIVDKVVKENAIVHLHSEDGVGMIHKSNMSWSSDDIVLWWNAKAIKSVKTKKIIVDKLVELEDKFGTIEIEIMDEIAEI